MNRSNAAQRAVAEIRWDGDPGAIVWVGSRPVHQYWPVLSAYFRDVLLPPQRRAEEDIVTWAWQEPANSKPPSTAELASLRKRLAGEQQLFAESLARGLARTDDAGGLRSPANIEQLGAVMGAVVAELVAHDDADLAAYVCRTETGLRLHSWGARSPARPEHPDTRDREISGRVLIDERPAAQHDVFLLGDDGQTVARMRTDAAGAFRFPGVASGRYRLQAQGPREKFPANGLPVSAERESVSGVALHFPERTSASARSGPMGRSKSNSRRRRRVAIVALLAAAGAAWWNGGRSRAEPASASASLPMPGERSATTEPGRSHEFSPAPQSGAMLAKASAPNFGAKESLPRARRTPFAAREETPSTSDPALTSESNGSESERSASPRNQRSIAAATSLVEQPLVVGASEGASGAAAEAGPPSGSGRPNASANPAGPSVDAKGSGAAGSSRVNTPPSPTDQNPPRGSTPAPELSHPVEEPRGLNPRVSHAPPPPPPRTTARMAKSGKKDPPPDSADAETRAAQAQRVDLASPDAAQATAAKSMAVPSAASADNVVADSAASRSSESAAETLAVSSSEATASTRSVSDSFPPTRAPDEISTPLSSSAESSQEHVRQPGGATVGAGGLTREVRFRLSDWQLRLFADAIVPTAPVRAGTSDGVHAQRGRLRALQGATLPRAFREPEFRGGLVLEVPPALSRPMQWRDLHGAAPTGAFTQGSRAELVWKGAHPPVGVIFSLHHADGAAIAMLRASEAPGEWMLRAVEGVRLSLWFALRDAAAAATKASSADRPTPRFSWRNGSGAPLGPQWRENHLENGVEHRIEFSLESFTLENVSRTIALLDHDSGWALVGELTLATEVIGQP